MEKNVRFGCDVMRWHVSCMLVFTLAFDALIVIRIDADFFVVGRLKGKLAAWSSFQLVMALQVRPAPYSTGDDVRKTFPVRNLRKPVKSQKIQKSLWRTNFVYQCLWINKIPVDDHPAIEVW